MKYTKGSSGTEQCRDAAMEISQLRSGWSWNAKDVLSGSDGGGFACLPPSFQDGFWFGENTSHLVTG